MSAGNIIKEILRNVDKNEKASIKYKPELAMEFLKWVSYNPENDHEKLELLLSKKANELSIDEIETLRKYKKNQELVETLKRYCSDKCLNKDIMPIYNFMNKESLEKIMQTKLTKKEIEEANKLILKYNKMTNNELKNYVSFYHKPENYQKLSMIEAYVFHEMKKQLTIRSNAKLENMINSQIEDNIVMRTKSYFKNN